MTDYSAISCKLTNEDVKTALCGYGKARDGIVAFLLAQGVLATKPFGLDLSRVETVRAGIEKAVRAGDSTSPRPKDSRLDGFRRELVFVTADAARKDWDSLVIHLYVALMERQAAQAHDRHYVADPDASAAGEYLLQCLAVQATYDYFGTYRKVLEQFLRVVYALKLAIRTDPSKILGTLLPCTRLAHEQVLIGLKHLNRTAPPTNVPPVARRPLVAVTATRDPSEAKQEELIQNAREFGKKLGELRVILVGTGSADREDTQSFDRRLERALLEGGASIVRIVDGPAQWAPTRRELTLGYDALKAEVIALPQRGADVSITLDSGLGDASSKAEKLSKQRFRGNPAWKNIDKEALRPLRYFLADTSSRPG